MVTWLRYGTQGPHHDADVSLTVEIKSQYKLSTSPRPPPTHCLALKTIDGAGSKGVALTPHSICHWQTGWHKAAPHLTFTSRPLLTRPLTGVR